MGSICHLYGSTYCTSTSYIPTKQHAEGRRARRNEADSYQSESSQDEVKHKGIHLRAQMQAPRTMTSQIIPLIPIVLLRVLALVCAPPSPDPCVVGHTAKNEKRTTTRTTTTYYGTVPSSRRSSRDIFFLATITPENNSCVLSQWCRNDRNCGLTSKIPPWNSGVFGNITTFERTY